MPIEKGNILGENKMLNLKIIRTIVLAVTTSVIILDYLDIIKLSRIKGNKKKLEDLLINY